MTIARLRRDQGKPNEPVIFSLRSSTGSPNALTLLNLRETKALLDEMGL